MGGLAPPLYCQPAQALGSSSPIYSALKIDACADPPAATTPCDHSAPLLCLADSSCEAPCCLTPLETRGTWRDWGFSQGPVALPWYNHDSFPYFFIWWGILSCHCCPDLRRCQFYFGGWKGLTAHFGLHHILAS